MLYLVYVAVFSCNIADCREVACRSAHGLEADVWSLGCMLYTMLVGKPPFDTEGVKTTLNRVILGDYEIPNSISPAAKHLIQVSPILTMSIRDPAQEEMSL